MNLKVIRYNNQGDFTQGLLTIDGKFQCYTLEDETRVQKVWGETCIPLGRYKVQLRKEGKFHDQYKNKFAMFHKGMLHVTNVPGFEYILIHIGNTDDDTAGCLLVGRSTSENSIAESTIAYEAMYKKVIAAFDRGEDVWIEYVNL